MAWNSGSGWKNPGSNPAKHYDAYFEKMKVGILGKGQTVVK